MAKGNTGGRSGNIGAIPNPVNAAVPPPPAGGAAAWQFVNGIPVPPTINTPSASSNSDWADMTDTGAALLRRQMGQTGDEAGLARAYRGDPRTTYIQTSKSYLVNNALNSDMTSIVNGYLPDTAKHWLRTGYTINDARSTIQSIDKGMKPLTQDVKLVRYAGEGDGGKYAIEAITGKAGLGIADLKKMSPKKLNDMFAGKSSDVKAYSSMSWRMDKTAARDRQYMSLPVKYEYSVQAGTHAVVTNNIGEHEVVVGRGYTHYCTGARMEGNQLVLSFSIAKDKRPAYYKV